MCSIGKVTLLVVALACMSVAYAQDDGVLLRYKFTPGQALQYGMSVSGNGTMRVTGLPVGLGPGTLSMLLDMTAALSQKCTGVDAEGKASVEFKYGEMNVTVDIANMATTQIQVGEDGATMTVNGKEQQVPEEFKQLLAQPFAVTMDDRGRITKVEGLEKLREMLKDIKLESFNFEQLLQQSQSVLPEGPVKVGDTWDQTLSLPMPSGGTDQKLDLTMHYALGGVVDEGGERCARLDFTGEVALPQFGPLTVPQKLPNGETANVRILVSNLDQDLRGAYYFDVAHGRVQRADVNQTLSLLVTTSGTAHDPQGNAVPFNVETQLDEMTTTSTLRLVGVSQ